MRRASNYDPYIFEGLLDLLEDRLHAITNAIAAFGSDSEDIPPVGKPAAEFAPAEASTTRTRTYESARDRERSVHEAHVIDEGFGGDGTPISSTSHDSTLVSDVPDHITRIKAAVDYSAQATTSTLTSRTIHDPAPTTPGSQSSRLPAFPPADELNGAREVQHEPASDDELWKQVDLNIVDDSVEVVSPDANQPTPTFSAVATLRPPPAETPSEASLKASPHYSEVVEKLRNVFLLKAFRKNQLAAIISTLDGRDAIVLMPTGGGKSLCFQLPAVCRGGRTSGVTIVVSPLRALMADQVDRLRDQNIDVMMLASMDSLDGNSMHEFWSAPKKPNLLYVTPEKLYCNDNMKAILKGLHARQQLARFVIDEAHLINTWGRDFRSSGYAALFNIRKEYPDIPIVALTATATSEALQDIVTALGLSDYVLLSQSFNRPNLRYKVIPKKRDMETGIVQFIKEKYPNETGIIYCNARAKTEEVALRLRSHGLRTRHFHAGMDDADKKRIQQQWQNDECKIIVATVAFGMGVDKADVRFVIHYDVPESVDAYCQETGRAGRDGKVSECILYYSYYDIQKKLLHINKDTEVDEIQKDRKRQAVHTVNQFCLNEIDCRRMLLLNHYTERFDPASCKGTCDNCASTGEVTEIDLTTFATRFVKMIQELQNRCMKITGALSIHAFRGTSKNDMKKRGFDSLAHSASGSDISTDLAKRLFDHLVARDILSTELEGAQVPNRAPISYVYLGPKAKEFLMNKPSFILKIRSSERGIGSGRPQRGLQRPISAPLKVMRRTRPRPDVVDDPVEPFPPSDGETNFDDIEAEPAGPAIPPLVQARRLRASPSIQVVEHADTLDLNQECLEALRALCVQLAAAHKCDSEDVFADDTLQTLSCMLPRDAVEFKGALAEAMDLDAADEVHEKWVAFGRPCLNITSRYAMRMRAARPDVASTFSPVEMHQRFDYRGVSGSSSKSLRGP
ncbi:P-loop containing nucleoside triphosphate hydrolase protein [Russula brevipes]|nr:P-loop containing nucleoside triphosphate hydrolase protein [Russula brevipes]